MFKRGLTLLYANEALSSKGIFSAAPLYLLLVGMCAEYDRSMLVIYLVYVFYVRRFHREGYCSASAPLVPFFVLLFCVGHVVPRRYFSKEASASPLSPPFPIYLKLDGQPMDHFVAPPKSSPFFFFFFRSRSGSARITIPATRSTWPMPRG